MNTAFRWIKIYLTTLPYDAGVTKYKRVKYARELSKVLFAVLLKHPHSTTQPQAHVDLTPKVGVDTHTTLHHYQLHTLF